MKSILSWFVAVIISVSFAHARPNINFEAVQRSTVFIYKALPDGSGPDLQKADATGSIISVPFSGKAGLSYFFLMTARHVVQPSWAGCQADPPVVYLRIYNKYYEHKDFESGTTFIRLEINPGGIQNLFLSDDVSVDAAIVHIASKVIDQYKDTVEFTPVPVSIFATDEELSGSELGTM